MRRHLIPHINVSGWLSDALTVDPDGAHELPPGLKRSMAQAFGAPTKSPEHDEASGLTFCVQWLGLMVEICMGRVR